MNSKWIWKWKTVMWFVHKIDRKNKEQERKYGNKTERQMVNYQISYTKQINPNHFM